MKNIEKGPVWPENDVICQLLARPEAVKKLAVFGIQGYITKEDVEAYETLRDVEKAALETRLSLDLRGLEQANARDAPAGVRRGAATDVELLL